MAVFINTTTTTNTLNEIVAPTDTNPPMATTLYRHTLAGSPLLVDKSSFRCVGTDLYYKSGSAAIVKLSNSGTKETVISHSTGDGDATSVSYYVTDTGDVYAGMPNETVTSAQTIASRSFAGNEDGRKNLSVSSNSGGPLSVTLSGTGSVSIPIYVNGSFRGRFNFGEHNLGDFTFINSIEVDPEWRIFSISFRLQGGTRRYSNYIFRRVSGGSRETLRQSLNEVHGTFSNQEILIHNNHLYRIVQKYAQAAATSYYSVLERWTITATGTLTDLTQIDTWQGSISGPTHLFIYKGCGAFFNKLASAYTYGRFYRSSGKRIGRYKPY